jgi:hypothetical protein
MVVVGDGEVEVEDPAFDFPNCILYCFTSPLPSKFLFDLVPVWQQWNICAIFLSN